MGKTFLFGMAHKTPEVSVHENIQFSKITFFVGKYKGGPGCSETNTGFRRKAATLLSLRG